jgi:hypothetical protein
MGANTTKLKQIFAPADPTGRTVIPIQSDTWQLLGGARIQEDLATTTVANLQSLGNMSGTNINTGDNNSVVPILVSKSFTVGIPADTRSSSADVTAAALVATISENHPGGGPIPFGGFSVLALGLFPFISSRGLSISKLRLSRGVS